MSMSKFAELLMEAINESAGMLRSSLIMHEIKEQLESGDPCPNPEHRIQPTMETDWKAVDNMIGHVLNEYIQHSTAMIDTLWRLLQQACEKTGAEVTQDRLVELEALQVQSNAASMVLKIHTHLIDMKGRGFTAQSHYADIIKIAEDYLKLENKDGDESKPWEADRPHLRPGQIH